MSSDSLSAVDQPVSYQHLQIARDNHVAVVTFNRPGKANALNFDHLLEIESAAMSFRDDGQIRVVIFTGAGKHFSSGADLSAIPELSTRPP